MKSSAKLFLMLGSIHQGYIEVLYLSPISPRTECLAKFQYVSLLNVFLPCNIEGFEREFFYDSKFGSYLQISRII